VWWNEGVKGKYVGVQGVKENMMPADFLSRQIFLQIFFYRISCLFSFFLFATGHLYHSSLTL
jgi:hypothetical protein